MGGKLWTHIVEAGADVRCRVLDWYEDGAGRGLLDFAGGKHAESHIKLLKTAGAE